MEPIAKHSVCEFAECCSWFTAAPIALVLFIAGLLMSGCAPLMTDRLQTAGPGQAAYYYRNQDCEVRITSAREVAGASVSISPKCGVAVSTEISPGADLQSNSMLLLHSLIDRFATKDHGK